METFYKEVEKLRDAAIQVLLYFHCLLQMLTNFIIHVGYALEVQVDYFYYVQHDLTYLIKKW